VIRTQAEPPATHCRGRRGGSGEGDEAIVGNVVNLNRFKKRLARAQADDVAKANRAKFGRSKAEKTGEEARTRRDERLLDQHRLTHEDET
jgi:hypothetical protein